MRRTAALLLLLFLNSTAIAAPPKVTISYSPSLDTACAVVRGYRIEAAWKDELFKDLEGFRDMWARIGPRLLSTTEDITGKNFADGSVSAYLTLCDLPSQSLRVGIVINMRYALSSFTRDPVPLRYKIGALYHEILHRFVDAHMPKHSALLAQHRGEPARVREHLHLLAVQKAVYLALGMQNELSELIDIDGQLPDGIYKRAWDIINQDRDAYLDYVNELKGAER